MATFFAWTSLFEKVVVTLHPLLEKFDILYKKSQMPALKKEGIFKKKDTDTKEKHRKNESK